MGDGPLLALEGDRALVLRQSVEGGSEAAGDILQPGERARLFERSGVELDRGVGGIDAGAAARGLFRALRVRRAVGAEKEFRIARGRGLDQRLAVLLALEHRQAVVV